MKRYSVAIRTLGLNPELLRQELESIYAQSIKPERVMVYIAQGYTRPDFTVGDETYVYVRKGMVAQRALDYKEIDSPLIMLLDDDVLLSPDSAERLLAAMEREGLDCISPDTFANHKMTTRQKIFAALTNLTFPHRTKQCAFRIKWNGSFSYINRPAPSGCYPSQSAAGPCALWRKEALLNTRIADELWLDTLGFAYNDDQLIFYKLYSNGGHLGVLFDCGVEHVGGRTASESYRKSSDQYLRRAKAMYLGWHRSLYRPETNNVKRIGKSIAFWGKSIYAILPHIAAAAVMKNAKIPVDYIKGLKGGIKFTKTEEYRSLPPYVHAKSL